MILAEDLRWLVTWLKEKGYKMRWRPYMCKYLKKSWYIGYFLKRTEAIQFCCLAKTDCRPSAQRSGGGINSLVKFGEEKIGGIENNKNITLFHYSLNRQIE